MPELPEVETIRRQLSHSIAGEVIEGVEVRNPRCYVGVKMMKGEEIKKVERKGKYLLIYFTRRNTSAGSVQGGWVVHLRMTGRFVVDDEWYETAKHTRVVVRLVSGRNMYYHSTRMFGYIQAESDMNEVEKKLEIKLGPEPWEISESEWKKRLSKTKRKIKDAILDQHLIAGVGNIYANDALYLAGIRPQRVADSLNGKEVVRLLSAIKSVMERGLELNGASDNSYVDALGKKGEYQNEFLVYGKTKGKCPECQCQLEYGKVGGRGTWWCGQCQV